MNENIDSVLDNKHKRDKVENWAHRSTRKARKNHGKMKREAEYDEIKIHNNKNRMMYVDIESRIDAIKNNKWRTMQ